MDMITLAMAKAYTDSKGGYTETQKTVLFPETTIEFEPDEGFAMFSIEPAAFDIVANEKVFVVFDGVAYNCTASAVIQVSESMKLVAVGNQSIGGYGDDTGEPFLIDCANEGNAKWNNFYVRDSDTHTVSIATKTETIHPIDPKFLPKGGVGYEESKKTVVLPETTMEINEETGVMVTLDKEITLVGDVEYQVVFDGVKYSCVCLHAPDEGNPEDEAWLLGNRVGVGGADTGEPFLILAGVASTEIMFQYLGTHTIAIYEEAEVVHQIDPKFIPGAVLPVVEIATTGAAMDIADEKLIATLDALYESALALLAKFTVGEMMVCYVMTRINDGVIDGFQAQGTSCGLVRSDNAWRLEV